MVEKQKRKYVYDKASIVDGAVYKAVRRLLDKKVEEVKREQDGKTERRQDR